MRRRYTLPRTGAEKMLDYRRRRRALGLRLVQLWAWDRGAPGVRERLRREAELVRGHASTAEGNEFLAELWDERLVGPEGAGD